MSRGFLFFGAYILEGRLTPRLLAAFETGVEYQIDHALALFAVALARTRQGNVKWH